MTAEAPSHEVIPVRAERRTRRYDKERGCYVYDISFTTRVPLTDRTAEVARAFGLGVDGGREHVLYRDFELRLAEGDVAYVTGDSGSGKSALLRALREDLGDEAADIDELEIDGDRPIVDTVGDSFSEALSLLSRVGLNDAFLFLRRYTELSDGQRYRYRIARMIDEGKPFWLADEFCSTLDRTTARIVAFNIQKLARASGATLVVATTHTDLEDDLAPTICVRKGWGEEVEVEYRGGVEVQACTVVDGIRIREGMRDDYRRLAYLHYREGGFPVPRRIFAMERLGVVIGVIVYSYPPVRVAGRRRAVGYSPDMDELNGSWAVISRVIVHPKYRTIGLGSRLIRETLLLQGCDHVELVAVMARYNPFAERGGMRLVQVSEPHGSVVRAIEGLHGLGFNPVLMASEGYNRGVLEGLGGLGVVREVLLSVGSVYFKRLSRMGKAYVRKAEFGEWLGVQGAGSLARVLSVLCTLNQSKAYLYWCRANAAGLG